MRAANFKDEEAVRSLTAAADDPSAPGPAIGDLFAEATGPPVADADGEVRHNNGATTTAPSTRLPWLFLYGCCASRPPATCYI